MKIDNEKKVENNASYDLCRVVIGDGIIFKFYSLKTKKICAHAIQYLSE